MNTIREAVLEARRKGVAVGHFNASNSEAVTAIFRAAQNLRVPVVVGFSEGERDFFGIPQAVAVVRSIREKYDFPIYVNADHTYSLERVKEAVDAGFDSVIYDGTELSFEDNVKAARDAVAYARSKDRDIVIECELGFIGKSSKVLDELPDGVKISAEHLTKPEDAARFVKETGADMLAPAVGNVHGMLRGGKDPALDIERVAAIAQAAPVPLVLHGASGNSAEDIAAAIKAGVGIVHINTELRVAFRKALLLSLQENPDEVAPYKYLKDPVKAMQKVVEEKLKIFNNIQ